MSESELLNDGIECDIIPKSNEIKVFLFDVLKDISNEKLICKRIKNDFKEMLIKKNYSSDQHRTVVGNIIMQQEAIFTLDAIQRMLIKKYGNK